MMVTFRNFQRIHLVGIGGIGMSGIAEVLLTLGYSVSGSDTKPSPTTERLQNLGATIYEGHKASNAEGAHVVVISSAIKSENPEIVEAHKRKIPVIPRAEMLAELMRLKYGIAVAGAHGKTTTTSMLSWIFHSAGLDPSFLIGGIAENFASSFAVTRGKYFIIEGDEYDTAFFDKGPKFLHYMPASLLLTHVEFDHADIYKDLEAVKTAFKRLVNLVPRRGVIVAYDGSENVRECVSEAFCRVESYGLSKAAHWRAVEPKFEPEKTRWRVLRNGKHWAGFEFPLAGAYNVLNATGAAAIAANYGVAPEAIGEALRTFKSVKRRLEVKAEVNGITIIDDFAHHPTAIAATLEAVRTRYPGRRLWAIFEPRSNTLRRKVFEGDLIASLSSADQIVVASVFRPEAVPEPERLEPSAIAEGLRAKGKNARQLKDADAIVAEIAPELKPGDMVVILSNGGFGGIYEKLPRQIHAAAGVSA